jgi:polysaccharide deacetylase 2 family uncharacterized protein YibQ
VSAGWRGLGLFWLAVFALLGIGAGTLQVLGPLPPPVPPKPAPAPRPAAAAVAPAAKPLVTQQREPPSPQRPGRETPGPIADPDPALLEPAPDGGTLPRIATDGRMPMQVYAAGFDRTTRRPRIGLVVAGIGMDSAASLSAIRLMPSGVTLAVSPYAADPRRLLEAARLAEHEYLLSLPMEPESFPLNDPGRHALMTSLTPDENHARLLWLLSRFAGYVGVTGAEGLLRGERFAAVTEQMAPVLAEVAERGLLYLDARPGTAALPRVWSADVDLVLDEPETGVDAKLAELERMARDKGHAIGLLSVPRPLIVQRVAAWAGELRDRGFAIAPVSSLAGPPADERKK